MATSLTWQAARSKLRSLLQCFLRNRSSIRSKSLALKDLLRSDFDILLGALPVSVAILVVSILSLIRGNDLQSDYSLGFTPETNIYRAHVVAAAFLVVSILCSILLVWRRHYCSVDEAESHLRKEILRYLSIAEKADARAFNSSERSGSLATPLQEANTNIPRDPPSFPGTSLSDIYPVYRRDLLDDSSSGAWHILPALLLVEGDCIALQVGDIVPANCRTLGGETGSSHGSSKSLPKGERITMSTLSTNSTSVLGSLPKGKTTISRTSSDILTLCNSMTICIVEEAPLIGFLRKREAVTPSSQVHRKIADIRKVMISAAVCFLLLSWVLLFARQRLDDKIPLVFLTPLMASLGMLPTAGPIFLILLEVMGTARILVAAHPHGTQKSAKPQKSWHLFAMYALATFASRLSVHELVYKFKLFLGDRIFRLCCTWFGESNQQFDGSSLPSFLSVPAASVCLLEKLGVGTVFALVDDELACDPFSTPQQLLIPSGNGLKLLDLCPSYDPDSDDESDVERSERDRNRSGVSINQESDSDTDDEPQPTSQNPLSGPRTKFRALRRRRLRHAYQRVKQDATATEVSAPNSELGDKDDVEFEDPLWWQHLPSLKCIGLACLLVENEVESPQKGPRMLSGTQTPMNASLIQHVTSGKPIKRQLRSLASCIGFCSEPNTFGNEGDLTFFEERLRMRIISTDLLVERLQTDSHALALEDSKCWGKLRSDTTSVLFRDFRSKAFQLLTVGDPRVVTTLCQEAWQGENSTILPLTATDKRSILDISNDWALSDLDVSAFSYSPIARTYEHVPEVGGGLAIKYLLENSTGDSSRESVSDDWSLVNNQIFLGILGSSVTPRKGIEKLLVVLGEAGVRFVYFSPRNMRRTKEVASQMGIDVAWNCAISLRPLDEGEDDPHRMVSNYADWDINAKLPHGIANVREHLKKVDNVPLLVSLFTDATKETTREMVQTFQEYGDTVIACGLSHVSRNADTFMAADISIGIDTLEKSSMKQEDGDQDSGIEAHEIAFVTAVSANACALRLQGAASTSQIPEIIASGRAALEGAISATIFVITGCLSFSLYCLLALATVSTLPPHIPTVSSVLYLYIFLPLLGFAMAMSDPDEDSMKQVPPKNDVAQTFGKNERPRLYLAILAGAVLPAALPQMLWLIAFGELMIAHEPSFLQSECPSANVAGYQRGDWTVLVRCDGLKGYTGSVIFQAGSAVFAVMALCVLAISASLVHRTISILEEAPWRRNRIWLMVVAFCLVLVSGYVWLAVRPASLSVLPWYFYVLSLTMPFICLFACEWVKRQNRTHYKRAVMMRRLQFETRLGMWSPKA